eukprot:CAMPEP_0114242422 /NCGR_PEP_ID=MMETSP0058-20121206/10164_1 /TAXON_ID=36894 /ORGANISM="Pyramimonas parkeae, CCMP726" /LENGTH=118 /DNA_ID=CAMNT_0001355027 /DNA_START=440 /DNA_END=796 /DNA_ORIENTATION=+
MDGAVLSTGSAFIIGALSKSIATVATYPMVRAKIAMQAASGDARSLSLFSMMRYIVDINGASALFTGVRAQLLKTVLAAALMLAIKEKSSKSAVTLVLMLRRTARKAIRTRTHVIPLR